MNTLQILLQNRAYKKPITYGLIIYLIMHWVQLVTNVIAIAPFSFFVCQPACLEKMFSNDYYPSGYFRCTGAMGWYCTMWLIETNQNQGKFSWWTIISNINLRSRRFTLHECSNPALCMHFFMGFLEIILEDSVNYCEED